jgi:hypothetical protein
MKTKRCPEKERHREEKEGRGETFNCMAIH